jgi:hypothetical protein
LCRKFENIGGALQYAYPEIEWDLSKFAFRGKKSVQRLLRVKIEELIPGVQLMEEYLHPAILWGMHFSVLSSLVELTVQATHDVNLN